MGIIIDVMIAPSDENLVSSTVMIQVVIIILDKSHPIVVSDPNVVATPLPP